MAARYCVDPCDGQRCRHGLADRIRRLSITALCCLWNDVNSALIESFNGGQTFLWSFSMTEAPLDSMYSRKRFSGAQNPESPMYEGF